MIQVGKHAWGTPKCGISLLDNTWMKVSTDRDYRFLLARNPYNRVVSLFADKVVDINGGLCVHYNIDTNDYMRRERLSQKQVSSYALVDNLLPIRNLTFKKFCLNISPRLVHRGDDHVKKQSCNAPDFLFDDIIWVEDLPECFKIPAKKVGVNIDTSRESLKQKGRSSHFTPKLDSLNNLSEPWNITVLEWWKYKSFPSDYSIFFDDELKSHIYELYRDDFEYLKLEQMK